MTTEKKPTPFAEVLTGSGETPRIRIGNDTIEPGEVAAFNQALDLVAGINAAVEAREAELRQELRFLRDACQLALPLLSGSGVDFGPAAVAADAVEKALRGEDPTS